MSRVSRQSSAAEVQLPPIPLEGKENFMQWKNLVIQTFQFHGMLSYLKLDSTKIDKDSKTKAFGIILIMSSISPVVRYVEDAGWDFGKEDQDPKDLYDLINRLYKWRPPFEQNFQSTWDPVKQFKEIAHSGCGSIAELQYRALCLRREMKRLEVDMSDGEATRFVVNALGRLLTGVPFNRIYERLSSGDLTWKDLMEEMASMRAWCGGVESCL